MDGKMGMEHGMNPDVRMMMWEKLDDKTKKMLVMRKLDAKIMMKEGWIKHIQYKIETLKMIKQAIEKM